MTNGSGIKPSNGEVQKLIDLIDDYGNVSYGGIEGQINVAYDAIMKQLEVLGIEVEDK